MTTQSASRRYSRLLHVIWITALVAFVITPDGARASKVERMQGSSVMTYASTGHH